MHDAARSPRHHHLVMMKKNCLIRVIIAVLLPVVCAMTVSAQKMSVKSFSLLENALSANIQGPDRKIDQNGEVAALIKVRTTETGFRFDGGLLGIVDTRQDVGEIYVWVPRAAKKLQIKHQRYGVLDYWYSVPVESGRTYLLELKTDYVPDPEKPGEQWFVLNVSPANAEVVIDGNHVSGIDGVISVLLGVGTHEFTIQAPMHRSEAGMVTITDKKEVMNVALAPDYGVLQVGSEPMGAEVYIDGNYKPAGITPFTTEWLSAGNHTLQFKRASYKTLTADVQVTGDGTTQPYNATLQPNFAQVAVSVPDEAEIYINNERKGAGGWTGSLDAGHYRIEARKASHTPSVLSIDVEAGRDTTITLAAPRPRYGSLNLSARPVGAKVFIDGKEVGTTPDIFRDVLMGTRTIRLEKAGYAPLVQQVGIEEGKTQNADFTLVADGSAPVVPPTKQGGITYPAGSAEKTAEKPVSTKKTVPTRTFLLAEVGYNTEQLSYGLMAGIARRAGGYVKFRSNFAFTSADAECDASGEVLHSHATPFYKVGVAHKSHYTVTGGYLQRLCNPLYLYAGAGYGDRALMWETTEGENVRNNAYSYKGVAVEAGLIGRIGMFAISAGCHTIAFKYVEASLGVGVNF